MLGLSCPSNFTAMDVMDHSDSEPSEILEHEGHAYEKKWTGNTVAVAASDWVLWKCVKSGCPGQIATTAVRTKRWRRKRFTVHRDVAGNRLTAFVPRRPHNHASATVRGKETSKQNGTTTAKSKLTPMTSPTTSLTDVLAAPSFKDLNEIDAFHSSEPKSSLSLTDIENINSINLDNVPKNMENVEQTVTNFDNGIKMSNINDITEFQAVKPVSLINHQTNSKERHLKDISVTVSSTNIIKNINKKNGVQINYGSSSMSTQNKNEEILCHICSTFFDEYCYNQHIQTTRHISACEENFKDRIDFENYRIFSCSVCVTTTEFFKAIEKYFTILVDHIILEHNTLVVDIYFFALYHEDSLNVENKNIAEVKHFDVYNKELTKNTDVYELYKDIVKSFMFQSDSLQTAESSWTLEEILFVEIIKVKKLFENEVLSKSVVKNNDNNEIRDDQINTDDLKKTEPLQLIRCKLCSIYVVQQNYEQHQETTAHKISLFYLKNEKIQINGVQNDNCFLSCRILSPKYLSIDDFFQSIESDVVELIAKIIQLQNGGPISVNIKMFGLYNHNSLISKPDTLGDVKSFMIRNEVLSGVKILLHWIQKILNKFKSHHQQYLKSMPQSYHLERVMFLDLCFYEMTSI
ncbi:uncharacterized protein LOC132945074 [Metopolophium dirhodum]|uniref:uncharacterized protein LOC132945074 n=1 Tax=Metopolophium dirhodum TaxID=44670 RepID=UPI00298F7B30|nr:uncharacterized protein LOC132945074 [Metopolophium dirhodum]